MGETPPVTPIEFTQQECDLTIPARFKRVVSAFPERIAIVSVEKILTYKDLDERSDQITQTLLDQLGDKPEPIVLLIHDPVMLIISLLGVIKAGKFFCVLNPKDPAGRMVEILKDLQTRYIITDPSYLSIAQKIKPNNCTLLNFIDLTRIHGISQKRRNVNSKDIVGIFYSSGSTGAPKGIPRDHGTILHRAWIDSHDLQISPEDRFIQLRQFMFAASLPDLMNAILNGGRVVLYDLQSRGLEGLSKTLVDERITILRPPIELFRHFIDTQTKNSFFPDIRFLIMTGDVLYKKDILQAKPFFPLNTLIIHHLSSSETGVLCRNRFDFNEKFDDDIIPVGYPVEGKEIILLDKDRRKVDLGKVGEIAVRTEYRFESYWNQPELTAQKIISDPDCPRNKIYLSGDLGRYREDGQLFFLGRIDNRVKIRGYSVDLTAIETAMMTIDGIQSAVCLALPNESGEKQLVAYYRAREKTLLSSGAIRHRLTQSLPGYMVPAHYIHLERFPMTGTGKINRKALPKPGFENPESSYSLMPPHDAIENNIGEIWKKVLQIDQVGISDDFFDVGGTSLTAMRLSDAINHEYQVPFTPEEVFHLPTIMQQAGYIKTGKTHEENKCLMAISTHGNRKPLFCISPTIIDIFTYKHLAQHLDPDQPFYALYASQGLALDGSIISIKDEINQFIKEMQQVQPHGPYYLAGYSGGGKVAMEMAYHLQQAGERVDLILMLDSFAPGYPKLLPYVTPRLYYILRVVRRIGSYFWKFWILDSKGKRDLILSRERPFANRFDNWIRNRFREINRPIKSKLKAQDGEMMRSGFDHLDQYKGKTILFRAQKGVLGVRSDPSLGWERWIKNDLKIVEIPGDHEAILFGPRAEKVARLIQDFLDGNTTRK